MRGLTARVSTNVVVVVVLSLLLVASALATYASGVVGDDSYPVHVELPEAGGLLPDQPVTVMGRAVGRVADVAVSDEGVTLELRVDGGQRVPDPARTTVLRRSPIGEQALDLAPTRTDWSAAAPASTVTTVDVTIAPEVTGLLRRTVELFESLEVEDVSTVVEEVAVALDGRSDRLRRLGRDGRDLQRTLVDGMPEFERLLDTSEATLAVLRDHRDTLRSAIAHGADLTEVAAGQRGNLDALLDEAPPALDQLEDLLRGTRPNLECLMTDLTGFNEMLLGPSTYEGANGPDLYGSKLEEFERALALHPYFFQRGFSLVAQPDADTGLFWLRVQLVLDEPQSAAFYDGFRATPETRPGAACRSEFGPGTDAVRQPGVQAAHETSPGIDYAPRLGDDERADEDGPARPTDGGDHGDDAHDGRGSSSAPDADGRTVEAGSGPGTSADGTAELVAGPDPRSAPDRPRVDLGVLVAAAAVLLTLPVLGWAGWWLHRRGKDLR